MAVLDRDASHCKFAKDKMITLVGDKGTMNTKKVCIRGKYKVIKRVWSDNLSTTGKEKRYLTL